MHTRSFKCGLAALSSKLQRRLCASSAVLFISTCLLGVAFAQDKPTVDRNPKSSANSTSVSAAEMSSAMDEFRDASRREQIEFSNASSALSESEEKQKSAKAHRITLEAEISALKDKLKVAQEELKKRQMANEDAQKKA